MPSPITLSFDDVKQAAVDTLVDQLNGLLVGVQGDVAQTLVEITDDVLQAAATGADDLFDDFEDDVRLVAEKNRVKAVAGLEQTAFKVIAAVLGMAAKLVIPTIPPI